MRILHTADWHLGQTFYGYRRYDEHEAYFEWLIQQAQSKAADALLIAGDLFDLSNPSGEALTQYYRFIHRFRRDCPCCHIYIIAGNHDSPQRLEAPRELLTHHHTYVVGRCPTESIEQIDRLLDSCLLPMYADRCPDQPAAYLLSIPYLGFGRLFGAADYANEMARFIAQTAQTARKRINGLPLIGMAHFFAGTAHLSEGDERERIVGLSEQVPVESFASLFDYLALGHLHRQQQVGQYDHIRYPGSPLCMSFAERSGSHGATFVVIGDQGLAQVECLTFDDAAQLIHIPSSGNESLTAIENELQELTDTAPPHSFPPFVEIILQPQDNIPSVADKLRSLIAGKPYRLARITTKKNTSLNYLSDGTSDSSSSDLEEIRQCAPIELAHRYYKAKYHGDMPTDVHRELIEAIAATEEALRHENIQ